MAGGFWDFDEVRYGGGMRIRIMWRWGLVACLLMCSAAAYAGQRLSVSAKEAKIRAGAGNNFDVVWRAEKYYPFLLVKKSGDWYLIKDFEGDEGWVHKSLVGAAETVITSRPKCIFRAEPKPDAKVLFTIGAGIPFKVVKRSGKWLLVEHADGDKGWVQETMVW